MHDRASVVGALTTQHPVFDGVREALLHLDAPSLDALVIASRRPLHSSLLYLDCAPEAARRVADTPCSDLPTGVLAEREARLRILIDEPALFFGQRSLTAETAMFRAQAILKTIAGLHAPRVAFFGDDDLVSLIVADARADVELVVVDIDTRVLEIVRDAAPGRARLHTAVVDLSRDDLSELGRFHCVCCDPFPTADGRFESFFWRAASEVLVTDGVLVTTLDPSHKMERFALGAWHALLSCGYAPIIFAGAAGAYHSFPFELTRWETELCSRSALTPRVHHTKSLVAGRKVFESARVPDPGFATWVASQSNHYLVRQAGLAEQEGLAGLSGERPMVHRGEWGLAALAPTTADASRVRGARSDGPEHEAESLCRTLGVSPTAHELSELARLAVDRDYWLGGDSRLAVAARLCESWTRGAELSYEERRPIGQDRNLSRPVEN